MSVSSLPFVDLRADYGVVANDSSRGSLNVAAINQAIVDHSGAGAQLVMPSGAIYLEQANPGQGPAQRAWSVRFGPGISRIALVGQGAHATRLVQAGVGTGGQWDGIVVDGASKITLGGFWIEQGVIEHADFPGDHHALIGVYAGFGVNAQDVIVSGVYFGPCIGDAFRLGAASGDAHYVDGLKLLNFTMRTQGHQQGAGNLHLGSRSGVSFQRGAQNVEIGNGYIEGAKNSPFEMEPTGIGRLNNILIHDLVINNALGQTHVAAAFSGPPAATRLMRSQMHNVIVLQGCLVAQNTQDCTLSHVTVYSSGAGPMARSAQALLQISQPNTALAVGDVRLIRDTGSTAGPLATVIAGVSATTERLTIDGGEWRSAVGAGANRAYIDMQAPVSPVVRGLRLQLGNTASNEYALKVRSNGYDVAGVTVHDVDVAANVKLAAGVWLAATNGKSIANVSLTNLRAPNSVTTGVLFDRNGGTSVDPTPILQGCDFTGATNAWAAQNAAAGAVFPIIAGSRGGVCTMVGTVAPELIVIAVLGSQYIRQSGGASELFFKSGGIDAVGWEQIS